MYTTNGVWGGARVFTYDQAAPLLAATAEYQQNTERDEKSSMVLQLLPLNNSAILTLVYMDPVANPHV